MSVDLFNEYIAMPKEAQSGYLLGMLFFILKEPTKGGAIHFFSICRRSILATFKIHNFQTYVIVDSFWILTIKSNTSNLAPSMPA